MIRSPARGTRRVRLVRGEGRGVSTWNEGGGGVHPIQQVVRRAGVRRTAGEWREAAQARGDLACGRPGPFSDKRRRKRGDPPPPLVLSGHAASLTPY